MTPRQIGTLSRRLANLDPAPQTELAYRDPYTLLVAMILSAQATDVGVNRATRPLFEVADNPACHDGARRRGLRDHVKSIGLYRNRTRAIAMSAILLEPLRRPGVGRKTASVVLNVAFGWLTIAVDTRVFRVANRTGLAPGKTPLEVEHELEVRVPEEIRPLRLQGAPARLPDLCRPERFRLPSVPSTPNQQCQLTQPRGSGSGAWRSSRLRLPAHPAVRTRPHPLKYQSVELVYSTINPTQNHGSKSC